MTSLCFLHDIDHLSYIFSIRLAALVTDHREMASEEVNVVAIMYPKSGKHDEVS